MKYTELRKELRDYYSDGGGERTESFAQKCFEILDCRVTENMTVMDQKILQYKVISEEFEPKLFLSSPFYYETGTLTALSDGGLWSKGTGKPHAGGWVYMRNQHLFEEQDAVLWEKKNRQREEQLYLICGPYNDMFQHFNFNNRPIFERGLKGIYEEARAGLSHAENDDQKEFFKGVEEGMLVLRRMAEKFGDEAKRLLKDAPENKNLRLIADTAYRVPWEAPQTFYEALSTLAFMRKALGSLEGVGPNTFGRLDMDLYPFYERDIATGRLTKEEAYELICMFLISWDCHYDHDMKMVGYSDHELENTYVLGGCDKNGEPLYNELTRMFLTATREEKIVFPKIKCRFGKNSPKEYLDEINLPVINGTSTILYQNDDSTIPMLLRTGRTLEEARDYLVTGCWAVVTYDEKVDHGNYLNLLKPFEYALHRMFDKMEKVGVTFKTFDDCAGFEEIYENVLYNCKTLLEERVSMTRLGGRISHKVNPLPIFSSTLCGCMENKALYNNGGTRFCDEHFLFFGFPEIIDSLLAIKTLVYDTHKYTLAEMLGAVRNNWQGYEDMRTEATKCPGWGDGSEEACSLAKRFNEDLFAITDSMVGGYGGKVRFGHLTYTEIRWWGEKTKATPNGRYDGEYFAQGLTPSRLKRIPSVNDVINSLSALDPVLMMNNVVNIILPSGKTTLDYLEAFLRASSGTALQSLQLNCTSKETLLDAQKHPEKYPDLIVRVTGFSAKFTALSPEWQAEVLTRNFYE